MTRSAAGAAAARYWEDASAGAADDVCGDPGDLTNDESVVWSDVALGELFDCGCCGVIEVSAVFIEDVVGSDTD